MEFIEKVDWAAYRQEAAELLSKLIQIDTSNPPGNETAAAQFLQEVFAKEGIPGEVIESAPGRGNFIARLQGSGSGPKLLLLSHLDVVPVAHPENWEHPPFAGALADGFIWGRGALDMKNQVACEALTVFLFKRLKLDFQGELIYLATADEERGGEFGAGWLVKNKPELVQADYVINEGGGMPLRVAGKLFYTIENVEKGILWLRLRVHGRAGHASVPHEENALARAARLIANLTEYQFPKRIGDSVRLFISRIAAAYGPPGERIAEVVLDPQADPELKGLLKDTELDPHLVEAFLRTTVSPTMIQAGIKENVIPDQCEVVLDCRLAPGFAKEAVLEKIRELGAEIGLEEGELEIEFIQDQAPSESPIGTDFYKAAERAILAEHPEAEVVPYLLTGGTDSRFFRSLGAVAYGICPLSPRMDLRERAKLIHADNERIDLESLELSTRVFTRIAVEILRAKPSPASGG